MSQSTYLTTMTDRGRAAARGLAVRSTGARDAALLAIAEAVVRDAEPLLDANAADVAEAEAAGMEPSLVDRLVLSEERLANIARDVRRVAALPDPVGEEFDGTVLPNGLRLRRRRVPLGVIAVIYESRPNVTIDVAALTLKSGNAAILRPGKESRRSSSALAALVRTALAANDVPADAVQLVDDPDRALVGKIVQMRGAIDLVVPRGGSGLIDFVRRNATVPVVAGGIGVCHTYVDPAADLAMALEIVDNAKTRRPSVCNALDTVLVHAAVAGEFLPALAQRWSVSPGVEMRCCPHALAILQAAGAPGRWMPAAPDDFGQEFLALRAAIKVVDSFDAGIDHIATHGSGHSEAIVTADLDAARRFQSEVDAAAVYVNASTGFTDGAEFGLGAELGISTQKFHARGPLGLRELTSYKWVIDGSGQIRP